MHKLVQNDSSIKSIRTKLLKSNLPLRKNNENKANKNLKQKEISKRTSEEMIDYFNFCKQNSFSKIKENDQNVYNELSDKGMFVLYCRIF